MTSPPVVEIDLQNQDMILSENRVNEETVNSDDYRDEKSSVQLT